jgi:hypothetical protein
MAQWRDYVRWRRAFVRHAKLQPLGIYGHTSTIDYELLRAIKSEHGPYGMAAYWHDHRLLYTAFGALLQHACHLPSISPNPENVE